MDNVEIGRALEEVADILEIQGANPFRIRAYRNAVRTIEVQTAPLARRVAEGLPLTDLPGIGKEIASHIREMVETGTLAFRDELAAQMPRTLVELMRLPGVGPKKARKLWDELQISTVDQLEEAAKEGRIALVPGFGAKSQEKILAGIAVHRKHAERVLLAECERAIEPLVRTLAALPEVLRLTVAGSYRRRRETVGDVDLLAIATDAGPVMAAFRGYAQVAEVVMAGDTRSTVNLGTGLQVDLRVVPPECYGAALVYFTGSKEHNVKLWRRAIERDLRLSEYGLFPVREAGDGQEVAAESVAEREEADVYAALGLPFIAPELREDHGEIEAAAAGRLPRLLEVADLRGDLQMHSTWSDGRNTLEEMVV
ncbi:MAG TPA: helix-hairpin-helix domain-containing protein, partial [Thermoanaerobaculia bacterium]